MISTRDVGNGTDLVAARLGISASRSGMRPGAGPVREPGHCHQSCMFLPFAIHTPDKHRQSRHAKPLARNLARVRRAATTRSARVAIPSPARIRIRRAGHRHQPFHDPHAETLQVPAADVSRQPGIGSARTKGAAVESRCLGVRIETTVEIFCRRAGWYKTQAFSLQGGDHIDGSSVAVLLVRDTTHHIFLATRTPQGAATACGSRLTR